MLPVNNRKAYSLGVGAEPDDGEGNVKISAGLTVGNLAMAGVGEISQTGNHSIQQESHSKPGLTLTQDYKVEFGSGSLVADTNLYRNGANSLKTDDSLTVAAGLNIGTATAASVGQIRASNSVETLDTLSTWVSLSDTYATSVLYKDGVKIGRGETYNYDSYLRRSAANSLTVDSDGSGGAASLTITGGLNIGSATGATTGEIKSSSAIRSGTNFITAGTGLGYYSYKLLADTQPSIALIGDGVSGKAGLLFGVGGSTVTDTNLYRSAADYLKTDDNLDVALGLNIGTATGSGIGELRTSSIIRSGNDVHVNYDDDTNQSNVFFGLSADTNLYRPASTANSLKTDDNFTVSLGLNVGTATGADTGQIKIKGAPTAFGNGALFIDSGSSDSTALSSQNTSSAFDLIHVVSSNPDYLGVRDVNNSRNIVQFDTNGNTTLSGGLNIGDTYGAGVGQILQKFGMTTSINGIRNSDTYGYSIGGLKSSASTIISANAYQDQYNVDSFSKTTTGSAATALELLIDGSIKFLSSDSGINSGNYSTFWKSLLSISSSGHLTVGNNGNTISYFYFNGAVSDADNFRIGTDGGANRSLTIARKSDSLVLFKLNAATGSGSFIGGLNLGSATAASTGDIRTSGSQIITTGTILDLNVEGSSSTGIRINRSSESGADFRVYDAGTSTIHFQVDNIGDIKIPANTQNLFVGQLQILNNQINRYGSTADSDSIDFNYTGYNGGTTYYRDTKFYNGKNNLLLDIDGSETNLNSYCNLYLKGSGNIIKYDYSSGIYSNTSDGSDNLIFRICGGGQSSSLRGAFIALSGNEEANYGLLSLNPGRGDGSSNIGTVLIKNGNGDTIARFGSTSSLTSINTTLVGGLNVGTATGAGTGQIVTKGNTSVTYGNGVFYADGGTGDTVGLTLKSQTTWDLINIVSGSPDYFAIRDVTNSRNMLQLDTDGLSTFPVGDVKIAGGIDVGNNGTYIKIKVINIGDWNMDSTASINVSHGLNISDIIGVPQVVIRDDWDVNHYNLEGSYQSVGLKSSGTGDITIPVPSGKVSLDASNVVLSRLTSVGSGGGSDVLSFFDSTSFDSTSYNRGYIIIKYK